jgi:hypothetical protein
LWEQVKESKRDGDLEDMAETRGKDKVTLGDELSSRQEENECLLQLMMKEEAAHQVS